MNDQYIVFSLAGTTYAVSTEYVAHVEMVEDVTRVPNAPPYLDGIVFSRGAVVPALNLRARFGFDRSPYDIRTRLVVVHASGRTVGLVVDAAREFQSIAPSAIRPPSDALVGHGGRYLKGIATMGNRMIMVLDLEGLLETDDLQISLDLGNAAAQELQ
jgi:purine-binding chemotaxis protein CheW